MWGPCAAPAAEQQRRRQQQQQQQERSCLHCLKCVSSSTRALAGWLCNELLLGRRAAVSCQGPPRRPGCLRSFEGPRRPRGHEQQPAATGAAAAAAALTVLPAAAADTREGLYSLRGPEGSLGLTVSVACSLEQQQQQQQQQQQEIAAQGLRQHGRGRPSLLVPRETPEEVKAEIRRRRQANPLPAARPLQNDTLRMALLGPAAYSALVERGPPAGPAGGPASPPAAAAVPVWVMRQAGRYLPEFRAVRAQHKFLTVCKDPLLAAEVTLQPLRRFPLLDAVIVFSDILVIPEAMGMPLSMEEGVGPRFAWRLQSPDDIKRLDTKFDVEDKLGYVFDAIYAAVGQLGGRVPLIGFCGAPLTLLSYMVEGGPPSKSCRSSKEFLFNYPDAALLLLQDLAAAAANYLVKQVDAGAQVFDTNAGSFSSEVYAQFGAPFLQQIAELVSAARPGVPLIAFPKDQGLLPSFASSKFAAVSLGWAEQRGLAKALYQRGAPLGAGAPLDDPQVKALQGNLDPQILYAPDEVIRQQAKQMVRDFHPGRYVANLGHGMEPQMDPRKLGLTG
ncbi:hypothetical protein Efla_004813 [Eimeria flavescens]